MEELLEILNDIHPDIDFETQEGLMDNAILDSMDIVRLVTEINDAYDINISAKYLLPENFNSVKAIYALIEKLKEE
ncbi:MAG: acyl carrier protein [Lachnospiraceae bacterium]|nr:acyl carrier protein [Lachnospiraceae bacterium]MCR5330066.1 acyl carrier protein [Lachnospiraceae bacterium]